MLYLLQVRWFLYFQLVHHILNYLQLTQPSLDIKPASVARDLFVDAQAQQISNIYDAIKDTEDDNVSISTEESPETAKLPVLINEKNIQLIIKIYD